KGWYVPNLDPAATLLGETQWAWLAERLAEPADVRLLCSSVQLAAEGTGWEGGSNFPLERQRLVDLIREKRAEGVVVISGDMHYADLSRWDTP
ncbi:alkaline phosphatase D family protein, partial [Acinetobacter baumannii]